MKKTSKRNENQDFNKKGTWFNVKCYLSIYSGEYITLLKASFRWSEYYNLAASQILSNRKSCTRFTFGWFSESILSGLCFFLFFFGGGLCLSQLSLLSITAFSTYLCFSAIISTITHLYCELFYIQVLTMVIITETLTSTSHHDIFTSLDYIFSCYLHTVGFYPYLLSYCLFGKN